MAIEDTAGLFSLGAHLTAAQAIIGENRRGPLDRSRTSGMKHVFQDSARTTEFRTEARERNVRRGP
jgi:hypothetical protein